MLSGNYLNSSLQKHMRYETSYIKNDDGGNILTTFIEKEVKKFICQAPISSGK